jgi:hypothetical protein
MRTPESQTNRCIIEVDISIQPWRTALTQACKGLVGSSRYSLFSSGAQPTVKSGYLPIPHLRYEPGSPPPPGNRQGCWETDQPHHDRTSNLDRYRHFSGQLSAGLIRTTGNSITQDRPRSHRFAQGKLDRRTREAFGIPTWTEFSGCSPGSFLVRAPRPYQLTKGLAEVSCSLQAMLSTTGESSQRGQDCLAQQAHL